MPPSFWGCCQTALAVADIHRETAGTHNSALPPATLATTSPPPQCSALINFLVKVWVAIMGFFIWLYSLVPCVTR